METVSCRWLPNCGRKCGPKHPNAFRLSCLPREHNDSFWRHAQLGCKISSGVLMGMLLVNQPALADDIQTVPAADVTQYAQPLERQEIKKNEIWLVFIVGAASLFGATLVLENNESLFPAISKANKAMKISNQQAKQAEAKAPEVPPEKVTPSPSISAEESEAQLLSAVESGLAQARSSFADEKNKPQSRPDPPKPIEVTEKKSENVPNLVSKGQEAAPEASEPTDASDGAPPPKKKPETLV